MARKPIPKPPSATTRSTWYLPEIVVPTMPNESWTLGGLPTLLLHPPLVHESEHLVDERQRIARPERNDRRVPEDRLDESALADDERHTTCEADDRPARTPGAGDRSVGIGDEREPRLDGGREAALRVVIVGADAHHRRPREHELGAV